MQQPKKKIVLINCDWRDIFRGDFDELYKKLERDRLRPDLNDFFVFSWAKVDYTSAHGTNFKTEHRKMPVTFFKPWFDFMAYFSAAESVEKAGFKPDAVVVYDFGFVPAARRIARKTGARVIMCINNMPRIYSATRKFGFWKALYSRWLETRYKNAIDEYFTINNAMKAYLLGLNIPASKIHIFAMDTINRDMAAIKASKKGVVRARYGIAPGSKVLICVARLEAEKGYPRLLDLFATLGNGYHLLVLGQGSLKAQLMEQAKKLGIADRVTFTGFVGRDDIWNHYLDSDAFVLLSKAEALGVVVWEAMYMNVPVLGSQAEGIIESTGVDGDRGYTVASTDGERQFKEKLAKCLAQTPEKKAMLARAKSYVEEKIRNNLTLNDIL
jgi:glycosyltransferase involved in cell wall biosynthesis